MIKRRPTKTGPNRSCIIPGEKYQAWSASAAVSGREGPIFTRSNEQNKRNFSGYYPAGRLLAIILLLLPLRFPYLEMELKVYTDRIEKNKDVYQIITEKTEQEAVIVSDASDAVWWYCDRPSIWVPVLYSDFKTLLEIQKVDYIYFENSSEYLGRLENDELVDFLTISSIVDGTPFGWSLYRIIR